MTVDTRLSLAKRPAPTGTSTARSAIVVDVRDAVREALVVPLVPAPAPVGLRLVVLRLVVVLGFFEPEEVVAMDFCCSGFAVCREIIEHVFVHDRLARVTTRGMKRS